MGIHINTFVVLDLESTGLPQEEHTKTRITEIALVAVSRDHIIDTYKQSLSLPRVLHKMSVCVNPCKMIMPASTNITGLSNELLEKEQTFNDNLCSLLAVFLERLPMPICILAHNGIKFDFPLLQAELYRCGKVIPEHILCADTLIGFQKLLHKDDSQAKLLNSIRCITTNEKSRLHPQVVSNLKKSQSNWSNDDEIFLAAIDAVESSSISETSVIKAPVKNLSECISSNSVDELDFSFMQKCNETTPKRKLTCLPETNDSSKIIPKLLPPSIKHSRKRIFPEEYNQETPVKSPKSFKLTHLYEFLLRKKAVDSHRAENDVLHLLECVVVMGPTFLEWANDNAVKFSVIKRM